MAAGPVGGQEPDRRRVPVDHYDRYLCPYWEYASIKELKTYSGEGIGGGLGLLFAFLLSIVNAFLLPLEIGRLYGRDGQPEPVTGLTGFWVLLPLVGGIIWVFKVQGRLNDFWRAHGAPA